MKTKQSEKKTKIVHESEILRAIQFIKNQLAEIQKSADLETRRYLVAIEIEQIKSNLDRIENQIVDLRAI